MVPGASEATGLPDGSFCAKTLAGTQSITRMPAAAAISPGVFLMRPSAAAGAKRDSPCLGSGDREVDVARDRLARELVGDLYFESIVARRKRGQLHALPCRQLMSQGHVELFRQRARIQRLDGGLVEELLGRTGWLRVEVVLDGDIRLVHRVRLRVVDKEENRELVFRREPAVEARGDFHRPQGRVRTLQLFVGRERRAQRLDVLRGD